MKTQCPKCGFEYTAKKREASKCKSVLFKDYIFTLDSGILRAKSKDSKCDLQLKAGKLASDYFTILNFYIYKWENNCCLRVIKSSELAAI